MFATHANANTLTFHMQLFKFKRVAPSDNSLMEQIFRLRYQVYGCERQFISTDNYPDGMECDEYDDHAVHVAAINRFGEVIGALRLIFNHAITLPIEKHVEHINLSAPVPGLLCFAEISRLVISKKLRQRCNGRYLQMGHSESRAPSQKSFLRFARPLAFGLCQQMYLESREEGVTHWLCMMEKGLCALLKMYGMEFHCIGEELECMGKVQPYVAPVHPMEPAPIGPQDHRYSRLPAALSIS